MQLTSPPQNGTQLGVTLGLPEVLICVATMECRSLQKSGVAAGFFCLFFVVGEHFKFHKDSVAGPSTEDGILRQTGMLQNLLEYLVQKSDSVSLSRRRILI